METKTIEIKKEVLSVAVSALRSIKNWAGVSKEESVALLTAQVALGRAWDEVRDVLKAIEEKNLSAFPELKELMYDVQVLTGKKIEEMTENEKILFRKFLPLNARYESALSAERSIVLSEKIKIKQTKISEDLFNKLFFENNELTGLEREALYMILQ